MICQDREAENVYLIFLMVFIGPWIPLLKNNFDTGFYQPNTRIFLEGYKNLVLDFFFN